MATCSYTSAEGRKCRNPSEKPYCRHHTCPGCEKPKQSRSIACKDCLADYKPTGADYRSTPAKQSDGADYRSADAVEHAPRKAATGAKPACWQKKMLLAQAEASRPATKHMQDVLTSFGVSGGRSGGSDVAHKFNYAEVEFGAADMFRLYDTDNSGSIDAEELRAVLFACGVKVTDDAMAMAMQLLGMKGPDDTCTFEVFDKWWKATYAKSKAARAAMIHKLGKEISEFLIPELKSLFAEFDKDCSGALDKAEFQQFYPRLCTFLGYDIPPLEQCLVEMDSVRTSQPGNLHDGSIEYEEFEAWFLKQEEKRMDAAAAAK